MRHDPADDDWPGRDRFVLSAGHSSLTLYIQLYLAGFGLELGDLEALRTWGSLTPGPPGVRAHRRRRDHHRAARPGSGLRGRDGDGRPPRARPVRPGRRTRRPARSTTSSTSSPPTATSRRASPPRRPRIAGRQQLGNLIVVLRPQPDLDRGRHQHRAVRGRRRSLRGVRLACPEGRGRRERHRHPGSHRERQGGHRQAVVHPTAHHHRLPRADQDEHRQGPRRGARCRRDRCPSRRSWASTRTNPSRSTTPSSNTPGWPSTEGRRPKHEWQKKFETWAAANPEHKALFDRLVARDLPDGWTDALPSWPVDPKGIATRAASGAVLTAIGPALPELWGGSADLAESNLTTIKGSDRSARPTRPPASGRRSPTAAHCTSASESTPWVRSCPASRCTARPARTAGRSCSSPTTCAAQSGWPP